jgi:1,4-alpha-glucan branching enzyme
MVHKKPLPDQKVAATFELPSSIWADSIHLVGDFNQWNHSSLPMKQRHSDGVWEVSVVLDAERDYQYRYLINGTDWQNDWQADRYIANPYDTENSVVSTY